MRRNNAFLAAAALPEGFFAVEKLIEDSGALVIPPVSQIRGQAVEICVP